MYIQLVINIKTKLSKNKKYNNKDKKTMHK